MKTFWVWEAIFFSCLTVICVILTTINFKFAMIYVLALIAVLAYMVMLIKWDKKK